MNFTRVPISKPLVVYDKKPDGSQEKLVYKSKKELCNTLRKSELADLAKMLQVSQKDTKNKKKMEIAEAIFHAFVRTELRSMITHEVDGVDEEDVNAVKNTLLELGFSVTQEELAKLADHPRGMLPGAAASILSRIDNKGERKDNDELSDSILKPCDNVRLINVMSDPNMIETVRKVGAGRSREEVDAKDDVWGKIRDYFNDFTNTYSRPYDTDDCVFTKDFRTYTANALKKAWSKLKTEFSKIWKNYKASGEMGTANVDGNMTFRDFAQVSSTEWILDNPSKMKPFADFSKWSQWSPAVLDYMFETFRDEPSLRPLAICLCEGGLDTESPPPAPKRVNNDEAKEKRKKARLAKKTQKTNNINEIKEMLQSSGEAENRRNYAQELETLLRVRENASSASGRERLDKRIEDLYNMISQ